MAKIDVMSVWFNNQLVGHLYRDIVGIMGFEYDKSWINSGFAISQQLPLINQHYPPESRTAHQFFANLLPEANARMHIVRDLKISDSDFELLKAVGGECAGALSILPIENTSQTSPYYEQITEETFKKLLIRKGSLSAFDHEKNFPRLSLAGAQDKFPIFFDGNKYFLPQNNAPSSHIIKFEITGYRNILCYEYFLNQLAKSVGLPAVNCWLKHSEYGSYLLIERFDRFTDKGEIQRLHQEDFCQALGLGYEKKYQQDGGASFKECYELVQNTCLNPIEDAENLLKWQIFNVLCGNSDGHAKNLALLYLQKKTPKLAPFYDLVCTRAIERVDPRLAFSVGGEFDPAKLTLNHWISEANGCNIRKQYLLNLIKDLTNLLTDNLNIVKKQFEDKHGIYPALQRLEQVLTRECKKMNRQLFKK